MLSDTQEEGDWFNMNGNAKRCVQTCWGQRTAQRLQAYGMDAKNTPVTGAVMMDFLRPEFKGYFKYKETPVSYTHLLRLPWQAPSTAMRCMLFRSFFSIRLKPCIGAERVGIKAAALHLSLIHISDATRSSTCTGSRCSPTRRRRAIGST